MGRRVPCPGAARGAPNLGGGTKVHINTRRPLSICLQAAPARPTPESSAAPTWPAPQSQSLWEGAMGTGPMATAKQPHLVLPWWAEEKARPHKGRAGASSELPALFPGPCHPPKQKGDPQDPAHRTGGQRATWTCCPSGAARGVWPDGPQGQQTSALSPPALGPQSP